MIGAAAGEVSTGADSNTFWQREENGGTGRHKGRHALNRLVQGGRGHSLSSFVHGAILHGGSLVTRLRDLGRGISPSGDGTVFKPAMGAHGGARGAPDVSPAAWPDWKFLDNTANAEAAAALHVL